MVRFLRNFVQNGPASVSEFAEFALRRTYRNGARCEPLSMEEIGAIQQAVPIVINVKLIHGTERRSISCDPATSAEEVCRELCEQMNIKSTFGWSLFAEFKAEVKEFVTISS